MSTEQELKEIILKSFGSVREFCLQVQMPYSTVDSIFKRGVENASVANIIKICSKLGISADELAAGRISPAAEHGSSEEEQTMLRQYRQLDDTGKQKVNQYVSDMYALQKSK